MKDGDETDTDLTLIENREMPPRARWERLQILCRQQGDTRLDGLDFEKAEIERHLDEAHRIFRQHPDGGTEAYAQLFLEELERANVIQKLAEAPVTEAAQPTGNRPAALTMVYGGALPRTPPPPKMPAKREGPPPPLPPPPPPPGPPTGVAETVRHGGLSPTNSPSPAAPKSQAADAEDEVTLVAETRRLNAELVALNTVTFADQTLARRIREHRFFPQISLLPNNLATWNRTAAELLATARTAKLNDLAAAPPSRGAVPSGVAGATPATEGLTSVSPPTTSSHKGALAGHVANNPPGDERYQVKVIAPVFDGAAKGAVLPAQSYSGDKEAEGPRTIPSPRPAAHADQQWTVLQPAAATKTRLGDQQGSGGKIIFTLLVVALITIIAGAWWYRNRQPATTDEPPPISFPIVTAAPTATLVAPEPTTTVAPRPAPTASAYRTLNDLPPKVVRRGGTICPDNAPKLSQILPGDRARMVKPEVATSMTVSKWPLSEDPNEDPTLWKEDYLFCKVHPPPKGSRRDVSACQVCRDDDGLPPRP